MEKRFKDPIYGYITLPSEYIENIIDTACFQRLRRIVQTSYAPLYASALHNRFVHSLGVYFLGCIASDTVQGELRNIEIDSNIDISRIISVFKLACLLHDVGHAPFSHTGENFYCFPNETSEDLDNFLIQTVDSVYFSTAVEQYRIESAAPHEKMSVIVALKSYSSFFHDDNERDFFARCITGYKYKDNSEENEIKNCFIELLNSSVIDVDKLDYLIRDAYVTGYNTINIDYDRLLKAITIVDNNNKFELAYKKSAISVLENVIYAHDLEKKWIQNHPVVMYEMYIIKQIINNLCEKTKYENNTLFSYDSLTPDGNTLRDDLFIRLLSDDDILFLMKNKFSDDLSEEYLQRRNRRHPIWKSYAEYKTFILDQMGSEMMKEIEEAMYLTEQFLNQSDKYVIDNDLVVRIQDELDRIDNDFDMDSRTKRIQRTSKEKILKFLMSMQTFASDNEVDFNFILIRRTKFFSGFSKEGFGNINICMLGKDGIKKIKRFEEIVVSLKMKETISNDDIYYLFYKKKNIISAGYIESFCKALKEHF